MPAQPGHLQLLAGPTFTDPACAAEAVDPNWFFPAGHNRQRARQFAAAARAVCSRCEHMGDCQDYALAAGPDLKGIWGGLTETDRWLIRHDNW